MTHLPPLLTGPPLLSCTEFIHFDRSLLSFHRFLLLLQHLTAVKIVVLSLIMQNNPPVTPVEFYTLGQRMTNQSLLRNESGKRRFLSHFGISPEVVAILWTSIHHMLPPSSLSIHLLWCLLFMKVYASESVLCGIVGTNEKSFRQHVWIVITAISSQRNQFVIVQYNLFIMSSTL